MSNTHMASATDLGFTERDFALYDSIIIKGKKTHAATTSIDKMDLDDRVRSTWTERGLPPVPKAFKSLEEPLKEN